MAVLHLAIDTVRRGGTISLSGVYGGQFDPIPMMDALRQADPAADGPGQRQALDRRHHARCSRATATRSGVDDFATHRLPLDEAPRAYEMFQKKQDGAIKILLQP